MRGVPANQPADPRQAADDAAPVHPPQLRERAMRSSAWTIAEYLVNNILRLGSNLILAHALFPEAFAIVAYASIVLQGLQMLSDIGLRPAIVQSPRGDDPDFLNTAWTFQVLRGVILFIATVLLGWPMAWFYNEPQLTWIVPACGLNFITTGLQSTAVHTCSRSLSLGRLTIVGIVEAVLKAAITIVWAQLWPSVWALVGGAFISYIIGLVLTHTALPGIRNRFRWERDAARALMHFGGWVFVSTMLTFFSGQADRLILGKLVPMGVVGVYSIALMFARLPYEMASRLTGSVLFPALAAIARRDRETFRAKLLESRDAILAVSQFGLVAMIIGSPWFFQFFYDSRYSAAAFFAPLLAATIWFTILQASADRALLALGDSRTLAVSNFANLVFTVAGCFMGYHLDQMRGFIVGVGLGNLAGHAVIAWALGRRGLSIIAQDLRYTGLVALASFIALGLPLLVPTLNTPVWQGSLATIGVSISMLYTCRRVKTLGKEALRMIFRRTAQARAHTADVPYE